MENNMQLKEKQTESNPPILSAENICFSYNHADAPALKNISFKLYEGESLGVLGPNGGGKSTLLKIIVGLLNAESGQLFFNGIEVGSLKQYPFDLFSYVPQNSELNLTLPVKVGEYMDFAYSLHKSKSIDSNSLSDSDELLELAGILHKKDQMISKLSGGERQRVILARALINKPKILFLDEPTKGLDSNGQDQLLSIIEKIKERDKTAVMIVDHNINQIIRNCHKILCLNGNSHWHDHRDLLTRNILEDIYHCEFEHLLIHEKDLVNNKDLKNHDHHQFCNHDHHDDSNTNLNAPHAFLRGKK